jgi:hypothetical protein
MYKSNLPTIEARFRQARGASLIAAVQIPMNKTAEDLAKGFTSGNFTQGVSKAAVNRSEPFDTAEGMAILYGTDLLYNLWWTVGHHNLFTRRFERVDKWTPHFYGSRDEMMAAYQRTYSRFMGGSAGGFGHRAASPRSPDT